VAAAGGSATRAQSAWWSGSTPWLAGGCRRWPARATAGDHPVAAFLVLGREQQPPCRQVTAVGGQAQFLKLVDAVDAVLGEVLDRASDGVPLGDRRRELDGQLTLAAGQ
jgi:hypothetical protein